MALEPRRRIVLLGRDLALDTVVEIARNPAVEVVCDDHALAAVDRCRRIVADVQARYKAAYTKPGPEDALILDYGVTTGFGEFKKVPINPDALDRHAENIILSHAAGVGETTERDDPANYYPADVVRAALVLRISTFLQGHSGVRRELVDVLVGLLNAGVVPLVPLRGSVGSSGDLCPLAHLFLILLPKGREQMRYYRVESAEQIFAPPRDFTPGTRIQAELPALTFPDPGITVKEGVALTNSATFSTAMLALAVSDGERLANAADVALALSLEAARGCARAFDEKVHAARGQHGQTVTAGHVRKLIAQSTLIETFADVQDPYSLRCAPAVHGATRDTLAYAKTIVTREINAVTDNPLFFAPDTEGAFRALDADFQGNWPRRFDASWKSQKGYDGLKRASYSAGNFHGQPVGLAADFLAIGIAELADISERRTQFLMDHHHNHGLPANLIAHAGLNSGFMIGQYCAAGLVSENKVLSHPASVDSIPTSSNSEDHNSMASIAALKLRRVLATTRFVLAIELMVAAQGVEWATLYHAVLGGDKADAGLDAADVEAFRTWKSPSVEEERRCRDLPLREKGELAEARGGLEKRIFERWTDAARRPRIAELLGLGTRHAYREVRNIVKPMIVDGVLFESIWKLARLIGPEASALGERDLIQSVNGSIGGDAPALTPIPTLQIVRRADGGLG